MSLGTKIRAARKSADYTQKQLADLVGISHRAMQAIESGETKKPHRDTLDKIVEVLDLDLGDDAADLTREAWSQRVKVFGDTVCAYVAAFPEEEQEAVIDYWTRQMLTYRGSFD